MGLIATGMLLGGAIGACVAAGYTWYVGKLAATQYPVLTLNVPENAEQDFLFRAWCDANKFIRQPNGVYRKGKGCFVSEIRFENNQMHIQEIVNFLFVKQKFALNAPIMLAKPIRLHKIKQLNKLIKHWQIEPIEMANEVVVFKSK